MWSAGFIIIGSGGYSWFLCAPRVSICVLLTLMGLIVRDQLKYKREQKEKEKI